MLALEDGGHGFTGIAVTDVHVTVAVIFQNYVAVVAFAIVWYGGSFAGGGTVTVVAVVVQVQS